MDHNLERMPPDPDWWDGRSANGTLPNLEPLPDDNRPHNLEPMPGINWWTGEDASGKLPNLEPMGGTPAAPARPTRATLHTQRGNGGASMKYVFGLLAVGVVVFVLVLSPELKARIDNSNEAARRRDALELSEQQYRFDQRREWDALTLPGRAASDYGWRIAGFLVLALGTMYAVDAYRTRKYRTTEDRRLIFPDARGMLPVARRQLEADELAALVEQAIAAWHTARIEEARRPIPPAHLTYAPKFSNSVTGDAAAQIPATSFVVPSFAELLQRGRVGKGNPLLLGFDQDKELTGTWLDLYSTIVAGMPGTGKTTCQRFLACQTALHGAKFAAIDPHAGAADDSLAATLAPLSACFVAEPASSDKQILEVVRYVADVGKRRIDGKDKDTTPLILWADELTALLGRSSIGDELAELMERIAQEYRKRFVFLCGSGQIFTAARATSELRDSFASAIVHRMRRNQARLLLPTDEAAQVERLETGRAVLWRTSGATTTIAIPNTTGSDVLHVAGLLASDATSMPDLRSAPRSGFEAGREVGTSPLPDALSLKAARVRQMLREKRSQNEILAAVWNANGGAAYQRAADEYREILAVIVGGAQ